jgi:hypothetical protein
VIIGSNTEKKLLPAKTGGFLLLQFAFLLKLEHLEVIDVALSAA